MKDTVSDPLYDLVEKRAAILGFLNYPEEYQALFSRIYPEGRASSGDYNLNRVNIHAD